MSALNLSLNKTMVTLISAECVLLVLAVAFLNYDAKANASEKRNSIHHVRGGYNLRTVTKDLRKNYIS